MIFLYKLNNLLHIIFIWVFTHVLYMSAYSYITSFPFDIGNNSKAKARAGKDNQQQK